MQWLYNDILWCLSDMRTSKATIRMLYIILYLRRHLKQNFIISNESLFQLFILIFFYSIDKLNQQLLGIVNSNS